MKPGRLVFALAFLAVLPPAPAAAQETPELSTVLERLSRVAGLYVDEALRFTCDERILNTDYQHDRARRRRQHDFAYVYVYEEPEDAVEDPLAGLQDYRADLSEVESSRQGSEVDPGEFGLVLYLRRAYSWAFIFADWLAPLYEFRLEGRDRAMGRDALVVAFEGKPPFRPGLNDWIGRAWIDAESYQLLRVDAMRPDDAEEKRQAERARARLDLSRQNYLYASVSTEFGVEENGMRFPSRVSIVGTWIGWKGDSRGLSVSFRERTAYRVGQVYTDYRFFSTRAVDEIRSIVISGREAGSEDEH